MSEPVVPERVVVGRRQPSPWLLGLDHLIRIRRDQLGFYRSLNNRYGDAVRLRLGPYRSWLLFHPDPVEALLTRESGSFVRFEKLMNVLAQWNGDSLLLAEGEAWKQRRKKVMPAFQTRRMPEYAQTVVSFTQALCRRWHSQQHDPLVLDIDSSMAQLSLDIALVSLFGAQAGERSDEFEAAIKVLSQTAFRESTAPVTLPDWLPLPAKRQKKQAIAVLDTLVTSIVRERLDDIARGGETERGDLLSILVEHHDGDALAIRNDAVSLLIAGHETSGALHCWVFALLAEHPYERDEVVAEIDRELGTRAPGYSDLHRLNRVRAVVEETLRIYPPAYALFLRRAVADVDLAGVNVRAGDIVQITPYTMHHSPRWFESPEQFRPGRFLSSPSWPMYAYLPFGAGPRVCVGQNFAMMEACLVVATMLQHWLPERLADRPVPDAKFSLRPTGGLQMMWSARSG